MGGAVMALVLAAGCVCGAGDAGLDAGPSDAGDDGGQDAGPPEPPPQVTVTGCWSAPIVVAPRNTWARGHLAVLPSGDALAVWQANELSPRIRARLVFRDGGLGDIEEVYAAPVASYPGEQQLTEPSVHTNRAGTTAVSFSLRADGGAHNEVLVTTRAPDGGWHAVERVDATPADMAPWTAVGIDGRETVFVAWQQGPALHARVFRPDAGWEPQVAVTPPETMLDADAPRLDVSEAGDALLTWAGYFAPTFEPEVHVTALHTAPVTDVLLDRPTGVTTLRSSMTAEGEAIIAWHEWPELPPHAAHYANGTFDPPSIVADAGAPAPLGLTAGFDALGRPTVWWTGSSVPTLLWSSQFVAGSWSSPVSQSTGNVERPPDFLSQASNGGRTLLATARDGTVLVFRDEPDAGVVDTIDGVVITGADVPSVFVGETGARWLLAVVAESEGWRPVAFFCR